MLRVGVIGCGYWGPNLIRNFDARDDARVTAVADLKEHRLSVVKSRHRDVRTTTDAGTVIADDDVNAVVIATPVATHHGLAKAALEAGKHVLVEKPLAASVAECEDLVDAARRAGLTLMVDHTFLYTGAVRKIKEVVDAGELGAIRYFDSVRVNLGLFQHDVNVIWDLAPHDLSIMDHVLGVEPLTVTALGVAHVENHSENVAYLYMTFPENLIAHVAVNWLAPVKIRQMLIGGDRKMVVYDDLEQEEKVKIYDKGVTPRTTDDVYQTLVDYRMGDMYAPRIDTTEALSLVAAEFVASITSGRPPLSDGESGLRIVRILEGAQRSMDAGGATVAL